MNIGIRLHDTLPGTLYERLGYARAQGFSCAHLALSKALSGFAMDDAPALLTQELAEKVKADFANQGMACAVLGCYLSLANPDAEQRARTQAIYRAHLRFSRLMGAGVVGTETPASPNLALSQPQQDSEEAFQLFLESVRPVVCWAEEEDAVLAIEPVWRHIVSTPEKAERMLEALRSDHVQIILDSVNLLSAATADHADALIDEAIRRLGDRVRVLHMKDYTRAENGDVLSTACGLGVMRYEKLIAFAKARDLPMTLEDTRPDNAEAARQYLARLA